MRITYWLAILCLVSEWYLVTANCPIVGGYYCANNGYCLNGACECYSGWGGIDCTVAVVTLNNGVPAYGYVSTRQMAYYLFTLNGTLGSLKIELNQTGFGDADLYVSKGSFPTRTSYNYKDTSTNASVVMMLYNVAGGAWYLGVYGYSSVSFVIRVTSTVNCPNACSNHGSCVNGGCVCYTGYAGSDCSMYIYTLGENSPMSGVVTSGGWQYYTYYFSGGLGVTWVLNQTSGSSTLLARFGEIPTLYLYDLSLYGIGSMGTSATVMRADPGWWYAAIYGTPGYYSTYNITVQPVYSQGQCINQCSMHGACNSGICRCNGGYNDTYCQRYNIPLISGQTVSGFVDDDTWNYYLYHGQTALNLLITLTQTNNNDGDCDLYVKSGSDPTLFSYDKKNTGTNITSTLTLSGTDDSVYHIGVFGYYACYYSLNITETLACPSDCSGHGTCIQGRCKCNPGWTSQDCSQVDTNLINMIPVGGSLTSNQWMYYTINITATSSLVIEMQELTTTGFLWLFLDYDTYPTITSYDKADLLLNARVHRVEVDFPTQVTQMMYVGVYGNPYSLGASRFKVVGWFPPF